MSHTLGQVHETHSLHNNYGMCAHMHKSRVKFMEMLLMKGTYVSTTCNVNK